MSDSTFKRFVEVGRVVRLNSGPSAGKLAVIVEIIDHNRALIDGPKSDVPRQAFPYRHLSLTPYKLSKLPRASGSGVVAKRYEEEKVAEKWIASSWSKKSQRQTIRFGLSDFDRFRVMVESKRRRSAVNIKLAKEKKAAA